jgi:hypothetical protein
MFFGVEIFAVCENAETAESFRALAHEVAKRLGGSVEHGEINVPQVGVLCMGVGFTQRIGQDCYAQTMAAAGEKFFASRKEELPSGILLPMHHSEKLDGIHSCLVFG